MNTLTKDELLSELSIISTSKYKRNVYRERLFKNPYIRHIAEAYRKGELTSTGIFARLGETAGLYMIALAEGYAVYDISRVVRVRPTEVRLAILNACQTAVTLNLIPSCGENWYDEPEPGDEELNPDEQDKED